MTQQNYCRIYAKAKISRTGKEERKEKVSLIMKKYNGLELNEQEMAKMKLKPTTGESLELQFFEPKIFAGEIVLPVSANGQILNFPIDAEKLKVTLSQLPKR